MNFVTSVFKRYMGKNETKTESEKPEENRAQSKNEPVKSEGLVKPSFSSSESLSDKQNPEQNECFQDAQEDPTISSNVAPEMDRNNRDNLFVSVSKGKVRGQIPDILCDTSSDAAMHHGHEICNNVRDEQENMGTVLPCAELDLLNTNLDDNLHESQKVIDNKSLPKIEPTSQYEDNNNNKSLMSPNKRIGQKSEPTTTNKSSENKIIEKKLVSLSDILDNNSVPTTAEPFESSLHAVTNIDATDNIITSEPVAKPDSALKALIHSVNNTFVMKSDEKEEQNTDLEQTEDAVSATYDKNDTINNELSSVSNLTETTTDEKVDSKSDRQDFERKTIENDITDENINKLKKDVMPLLSDHKQMVSEKVNESQIDSVEAVENHDEKVINAVPKFETSETLTNIKEKCGTKEVNAVDLTLDLMEQEESKPGNIKGVADEINSKKQSLEKVCKTEQQDAKMKQLEKTETNVYEKINNCKELDADTRHNAQTGNYVEKSHENLNEAKISHSCSENIPTEMNDHETITHTTENSVETVVANCDENLLQMESKTAGKEHHEILGTDPAKTSITNLKSGKINEKDVQINSDQNNEVKVSEALNLEPIVPKISQICEDRKEEIKKDLFNVSESQNTQQLSNTTNIKKNSLLGIHKESANISSQNQQKPVACLEDIINQNCNQEIFDEMSCIQDLANNLPTILEESMNCLSTTSTITEIQTAENTKDLAAKLEKSVIDSTSSKEQIEVEVADKEFSETPSINNAFFTESKSLVSSNDTEKIEEIEDQIREESVNTNHESLAVSTTRRSVDPLEESQLKSEADLGTENIQCPTNPTEKIHTDERQEAEEFTIIGKQSNEDIIADSIMSTQEHTECTANKFCRIFERQDTQEFENLERQFEEQNQDVNKLQTADILEELILESSKAQQSKTDNDSHRKGEHEHTDSNDKHITKHVETSEEIQCADKENFNILQRQDTQEFEHFEKQYKEEECYQLKSDNILEELVGECTGQKIAEDISLKTEITIETNLVEEDLPDQNTLIDSVEKEVIETETDLSGSKTETEVVCLGNVYNGSTQCDSGKESNKQNQKGVIPPTKITKELNNNLKDNAGIHPDEKIDKTNKNTQNRTLPKTQDLNIKPLTNEYQNRNKELINKVDLLQQQLDTIRKGTKRKTKQTQEPEENKDTNIEVISKYKNLIEEYEKQIVQQDNDLEKMRVKCEENIRRFTTTEMAFSDVFEKYEKAKYAITLYTKNEDILLDNIQNAEEQLSQVETKCLSMKQQVAEQINRAHEQVEREKAKCKQEITKLQVHVKMLEIKAASLETAFKQKSDECQALAALCEDITGRNATRA